MNIISLSNLISTETNACSQLFYNKTFKIAPTAYAAITPTRTVELDF